MFEGKIEVQIGEIIWIVDNIDIVCFSFKLVWVVMNRLMEEIYFCYLFFFMFVYLFGLILFWLIR